MPSHLPDRVDFTVPTCAVWTAPVIEENQEFRARWVWLAASTATIAVFLVTCSYLIYGLLVGTLAAVIGAIGSQVSRARAVSAYQADIPDGPELFTVRIRVLNKLDELGSDVGQVWFEGNCLHYNGRATSFSLGGQDVATGEERSQFTFGEDETNFLPRNSVPLYYPGWRLWVHILPTSFGGGDRASFKRLTKQLDEFVALRREYGGDRQYPPTQPQPLVIR